jgi:hypothetical protein
VDRQFAVRFPLPRLHHISRLFTLECDSRAPARPLIAVSQNHRDFQWVNNRTHVERVKCPRIVNLRRKRMQKRHSIRRLHIDFYTSNATNGATQNSLDLFNLMFNSMHPRLAWAKALVQSMRSLSDDAEIHVRLMLNDVEDIEMVRMSQTHVRCGDEGLLLARSRLLRIVQTSTSMTRMSSQERNRWLCGARNPVGGSTSRRSEGVMHWLSSDLTGAQQQQAHSLAKAKRLASTQNFTTKIFR